jgi:hypothetical protein
MDMSHQFGCHAVSRKDSNAVTASFESLKNLPGEDFVIFSRRFPEGWAFGIHVPKARQTGIPLPGTWDPGIPVPGIWDPGNPAPGPGFFGKIPGLGHPGGISRERDIPGLFHKTREGNGIPAYPMGSHAMSATAPCRLPGRPQRMRQRIAKVLHRN